MSSYFGFGDAIRPWDTADSIIGLNRDLVTAVHESGHAVAAMWLAGGVANVFLQRTTDSNGEVWYRVGDAGPQERAVIALAGHAAVHRLMGPRFEPVFGDQDVTDARAAVAEGGGDPDASLPTLRLAAAEMFGHAGRWAQTCKVASALYERKHLRGDAVRQLAASVFPLPSGPIPVRDLFGSRAPAAPAPGPTRAAASPPPAPAVYADVRDPLSLAAADRRHRERTGFPLIW